MQPTNIIDLIVQGGRNYKDPPDQVTQAKKKNKENIFVAMSKFPLNAYYTKNNHTKTSSPESLDNLSGV